MRCESCGGEMRRVVETIDAWFDSGSMPFAQFHHPFENDGGVRRQRFPADYICEGLDQTRGWFYSLLAVATQIFDRGSYEHCVCLGLIADPDGQKMSKSRGNVVDPWEVLDRHGADAFRWYYLSSQQPWAGYRFSADTVGEAVRQFMLTLWNTYSFFVLYANAEDLGPADFAGAALGEAELDRWALSRLQGLTRSVTERMDDFDCTTAGREIAAYVDELSNWYVRLNRRRFWDGDRAAFATLRHCLIEVSKLLAPFTPFLADEIHANLTGDRRLGSPRRLPRARPRARRRRARGGRRGGDARDRARARRPRTGEDQEPPAAAPGGDRRHRGRADPRSSGSPSSSAPSSTSRSSSSSPRRASWSPTRSSPTSAPSGRASARRCPRWPRRSRRSTPSHVAEAIEGARRIGINVDGAEHALEPADMTLVMEPLDGYEVEAEAGRAVALALELDDELLREGLAREIVHAVQNARKRAGLDVSDRISLTLSGDAGLVEAARSHEDYIAGETLATTVAYDGDGLEAAASIEGRELAIGIEKKG